MVEREQSDDILLESKVYDSNASNQILVVAGQKNSLDPHRLCEIEGVFGQEVGGDNGPFNRRSRGRLVRGGPSLMIVRCDRCCASTYCHWFINLEEVPDML